MGKYILRRLALMVPVAFLVSIMVFLLVHLTPGDPVQLMLGAEAGPDTIAAMRHELGLDRPLPVQYVSWLAHALSGNLGYSIRTHQPVLQAIVERLPASIELASAAMLIALCVAIPLGIISAVARNPLADFVAASLALMGVALPNFFLGILLIFFFALQLRLVPPSGYVPLSEDAAGNLGHLLLPALTLGAAIAAVVMRQTRSSLMEALAQEWALVARAKGLSERAVVLAHALKNALIPVVTVVGLQMGTLLGGAVITETLFAWPGLGKLAIDNIFAHDYFVVQSIVLFFAAIFMVSNLAVDLVYGLLNPRIRYD